MPPVATKRSTGGTELPSALWVSRPYLDFNLASLRLSIFGGWVCGVASLAMVWLVLSPGFVLPNKWA